ncbi:ribonuclease Z [Candidatus Woesearchaeota archaeon]|nr:ribonuclease Z [Candidatus Woesearchaeota archaeon]
MELTFLGTSSMTPSKERNHPAVFLEFNEHGLLFDCGEGTQRQFKIANIRLTKISKIFLTHWHGDHALGIGGLLQTLGASEYSGTLELYGPPGTEEHLYHFFKAIPFGFRVDFVVKEVGNGVVFENSDFVVEAALLDHGTPCYAYSFMVKDKRAIDMDRVKSLKIPVGPLIGKLQMGGSVNINGSVITPDDVSSLKKGKKIVYLTDTRLCSSCYDISEGADVLICESSFTEAEKDKAEEYKHLTAQQAGLIASKSGAKKLFLFHISGRHADTSVVLEEARVIHHDSHIAQDFMRLKL